MLKIIKKHWFLAGLVAVFAVVLLDPSGGRLADAGIWLKGRNAPEIMIFLIFIVSGLMLDGEKIKAGIKDFKATVLALTVIFIGAPLCAWMLSFLPFDTGVVVGLFIVAAMPTTLSSGVVMTGTAGGNMAHALFITIVSNIICIVSIPFVLSGLLSVFALQKQVVLEHDAIIVKLGLLVLMPLIIGLSVKTKFSQTFTGVRYRLQVINQSLIILIVFISFSGARQVLLGNGISFLYIVAAVAVFHLMMLAISFILKQVFHIPRGRCESIIFMGSQKTLPLSVMVQVTYFSEYGTALLVCVCHHIVHLMIDGYISTKMGARPKGADA